MSVIKIEQWYHEGAPPIWHVKCPKCHCEYRITEFQRFPCVCEENEINMDEHKPGEAASVSALN